MKMKVLFQPDPNSMAREIGEVVSHEGWVTVIAWDGKEFTRDRMTDFVRDMPNAPVVD